MTPEESEIRAALGDRIADAAVAIRAYQDRNAPVPPGLWANLYRALAESLSDIEFNHPLAQLVMLEAIRRSQNGNGALALINPRRGAGPNLCPN